MFSTARRQVAWLIGVAAIGLLAVGALAYQSYYRQALRDVHETLELQRSASDAIALLRVAETGQRGFLLAGTADFLEPYRAAQQALPGQLRALRRAARKPADRQAVARLSSLAESKMGELAETIALHRAGRHADALAIVMEGRGRRLMVAAENEVSRLLLAQRAELAARQSAADRGLGRLLAVLTGAWIFLVLAVGAGIWSARRSASEARRSADLLRSSELAYRTLADGATDLVRVANGRGDLVYVSPSCKPLLGFSQAEMLAMPPRALLHDDEREHTRALFEQVMGGGRSAHAHTHRLRTSLGEHRWFETQFHALRNDKGELDGVHLTSRDITERHKAEAALRAQTELLNSILASMGDGVVVLAPDRRVLAINGPAREFVSWSEGDIVPKEWAREHVFLLDGTTPCAPEHAPMTRALRGEPSESELVLRIADGRFRVVRTNARPIHDGATLVGCVAVLHDTTERRQVERELKESEQQLRLREVALKAHGELMRALSLRDDLTGLYNRRGFSEIADQALRTLTRAKLPGCLFFADLNGLKIINDTLGHELGNHAIGAAAEVLRAVFRDSDVVARLGGDEFAVLAQECGLGDVLAVLQRIDDQVALRNRQEQRYTLSLSIGTAVFEPPTVVDLNALMDAADQAMYEQKRLSKQRRGA